MAGNETLPPFEDQIESGSEIGWVGPGSPTDAYLKTQTNPTWLRKQLLQLLIQTIVAPSVLGMSDNPMNTLKIRS